MKTEVFDFYNSTSIKSYNLDETIRYQLKMLDEVIGEEIIAEKTVLSELLQAKK